jgi:hypothetical protein
LQLWILDKPANLGQESIKVNIFRLKNINQKNKIFLGIFKKI